MDVLWSSLSTEAKTKTFANKKVSDITTTDNGVVVSCADGTSYEGSMVIGADGTYSMVRKYMRLLALKDQQEQTIPASVNDENPYLTTYRCFWVRLPVLPTIKVGDAHETHGPTITIQFFVGKDSAIIGVYEKLDQPTREPSRYNEADEVDFVKKWGHLPLTKTGDLTLGQACAVKMNSGLINLEEGVVQNWSYGGRMVLAGDAAHKFTPSTGAGCNNGIVDIVVLANHLNRAFSSGVPSADTLATAFKEYQAARFDIATEGCKIASNTTAAATWANFIFKFLDLRVFSIQMVQKFFINLGVAATAQTPVFDYIEGEEQIVGSVPWVYPIPSRTQTVS
jgi:2-polyprenyl-6-methoxyphenol hydroxylase-like FAD-dependent oxidoreductase